MRLVKVYAVRTSDFHEEWINEDSIQTVTKTSLTLPRTKQEIKFALALKTPNPFECYLDLSKPIEFMEFKEFIKNECKGLKE